MLTLMTRARALLALPLLILPLAACGGGGSSAVTKTVTASASSPASQPSSGVASEPTGETAPINPVTLLKKIPGCHFKKGVTNGEYDVDNNLYTECAVGADSENGDYYPTGHDYNFTLRSGPGTRPQPSQYEHVDDTDAIIYGPTWFAVMSPTFSDSTLTPAVTAKYAKQLGGKVAKSDAEIKQ